LARAPPGRLATKPEEQADFHDLQATIVRRLGLDRTRLTYRPQRRDFRLTDVAGA
jgi:hypothetical protein